MALQGIRHCICPKFRRTIRGLQDLINFQSKINLCEAGRCQAIPALTEPDETKQMHLCPVPAGPKKKRKDSSFPTSPSRQNDVLGINHTDYLYLPVTLLLCELAEKVGVLAGAAAKVAGVVLGVEWEGTEVAECRVSAKNLLPCPDICTLNGR